MQKISPFLWFDSQAEEAANFYISVFKDGKIGDVSRYDEAGAKAANRPVGSVMAISFELFGQHFSAINGGPIFKFTEAISFVVECESQKELDLYWDQLSAVPESEQCGWLKDKYGLSWQIIPKKMSELMSDPDPKKSGAVMKAMLAMKRINIAMLQKAYDEA